MVLTQTRKTDVSLKEREREQASPENKDQSVIRNYRGKLQWVGNLDEMRTDK